MDPENKTPFTEEQLSELYSLSLSKREWIIIFNVLVGTQYRIGDARALWDAVRKIESIVAVDSNIAPKGKGKVALTTD